MFRVVIALALALASVKSKSVSIQTNIIGGHQTDIESYPHQVQLQMYEQFFCGGSIIGPKHILTAAHCTFVVENVGDLTVRAGTSQMQAFGVTFAVVDIKVHNYFNITTFDNDISLVKLSKSIDFGSTMRAILLPGLSEDVVDGADMDVTGWGVTSGSRTGSMFLQKVTVAKINSETCQKNYGNLPVTSNMICAAAPGKDSCQGDSGGPLIIGSTQYGIVSWGAECADSRYPGVYTKVSEYITWINENMV